MIWKNREFGFPILPNLSDIEINSRCFGRNKAYANFLTHRSAGVNATYSKKDISKNVFKWVNGAKTTTLTVDLWLSTIENTGVDPMVIADQTIDGQVCTQHTHTVIKLCTDLA